MVRRYGGMIAASSMLVVAFAACSGSDSATKSPGRTEPSETLSEASIASTEVSSTQPASFEPSVTGPLAAEPTVTEPSATEPNGAPPVTTGVATAGETVDGRFSWPVDLRPYRVVPESLYFGFDPPLVNADPPDIKEFGFGPASYGVAILAAEAGEPWAMFQIDPLSSAQLGAGTFDPMSMPGDNLMIGDIPAAIRSNRATFGPVDGHSVRLMGRLERSTIESLIASFQLVDGVASVVVPGEFVDAAPFAYLSAYDVETLAPEINLIDWNTVWYEFGDEFIALSIQPVRPIDPITEFAINGDAGRRVTVGTHQGAAVTTVSGAHLVRWQTGGVNLEVRAFGEGLTLDDVVALAGRVRAFTAEEWAALSTS